MNAVVKSLPDKILVSHGFQAVLDNIHVFFRHSCSEFKIIAECNIGIYRDSFIALLQSGIIIFLFDILIHISLDLIMLDVIVYLHITPVKR